MAFKGARIGVRLRLSGSSVENTYIADYIGVKPETLSRAIRKLEQERRIRIPESDQVILADIPAMRQIANGGRPRQSRKRA